VACLPRRDFPAPAQKQGPSRCLRAPPPRDVRHHAFAVAHPKRLEQILRSVCTDFELVLKEFDGEPDHVHLLANYPPKVRLYEPVNSLKGVSCRRMKQEFPAIATFWSVRKRRGTVCELFRGLRGRRADHDPAPVHGGSEPAFGRWLRAPALKGPGPSAFTSPGIGTPPFQQRVFSRWRRPTNLDYPDFGRVAGERAAGMVKTNLGPSNPAVAKARRQQPGSKGGLQL
jgi:hypothetical protein